MKQYRELLKNVFAHGTYTTDRTGTGTISRFGAQERFDISGGKIPLLQGKKVPVKSVTNELLWLIGGESELRPLLKAGVKYWTYWNYERYIKGLKTGDIKYSREEFESQIINNDEFNELHGNMGPIYPTQWRNHHGVDQLGEVVELIKKQPDSRRMIVDSWSPEQLDDMVLPPCHMMYQFKVVNNKLSCQIYIRSNDLFLGAPTNIYMYALLTHMVAQVTGTEPHELIYTVGDSHIYSNHIEQACEYLDRNYYRPSEPTVKLNKDIKSIDDFKLEDIEIINYNPLPAIKGDVAV